MMYINGERKREVQRESWECSVWRKRDVFGEQNQKPESVLSLFCKKHLPPSNGLEARFDKV